MYLSNLAKAFPPQQHPFAQTLADRDHGEKVALVIGGFAVYLLHNEQKDICHDRYQTHHL